MRINHNFKMPSTHYFPQSQFNAEKTDKTHPRNETLDAIITSICGMITVSFLVFGVIGLIQVFTSCDSNKPQTAIESKSNDPCGIFTNEDSTKSTINRLPKKGRVI